MLLRLAGNKKENPRSTSFCKNDLTAKVDYSTLFKNPPKFKGAVHFSQSVSIR